MAEFHLMVEGEGATHRAAELQQQLALLWPDVEHDWVAPTAPTPEGPNKTDPLAVAALVLSIPSAILAAIDLAERVKLADKLRRLSAWARGKEIKVRLPDGREEKLEDADAGEWIDIAIDVDPDNGSTSGSPTKR